MVDLVVSSPPYNIGKEYEKKQKLEDYMAFQKQVIKEIYRILKKNGTLFWQVASYVDTKTKGHIPLDIVFFPIFDELGMVLINRVIWVKDHGLSASKRLSCRYETALWFSKSSEFTFNLDALRVPQKWPNKTSHRKSNYGERTCNELGKNPGDVWAFGHVKHNHEEQTIHPAQFPEDLVERIMILATNEGDLVLDPFMGVGTVAVVAKNYNRKFIGMEISEKYVKIANDRLLCEPDDDGNFPNLKSLRDFCIKHHKSPINYHFTRQTANTPSIDRKIDPESKKLDEYIVRRKFESDNAAFKFVAQSKKSKQVKVI